MSKDVGTMLFRVLFSACMAIIPSLSQCKQLDNIKVRSAISLAGRVVTNDHALELVNRHSLLIYEINLPQYIDEVMKYNPKLKPDFTDHHFAVVGSMAAVDAAITLSEGVKNIIVIRRDNAAGFPGRPNPTNDKLHTKVQGLNAARNIIELIRQKLKSGVVTVDASLLEKLKEAQTWFSTQTGGHLGQGMTIALKKAGVMRKLQTKWGGTSIKFRSFSAGVGNGLDFLINGYNTVVNSLALNEEISDANILALTSSLTAMAGDVTMGIAQVLSNSAKVSKFGGPIGFAISAVLFIASYSMSVAQGFTSQENLETKDYVKIFLEPLVPQSPMYVDLIDHLAKGNYHEFNHLYLSQSIPGRLTSWFVGISDSQLHRIISDISRRKLKKLMAKAVATTVRDLKPKQVLYPFPDPERRDHYKVEGWKGKRGVKKRFKISSELSRVRLFMATYSNDFAKPSKCLREAEQGYTFCPDVAPHRKDKLIFIGYKEVIDKVMLDDNCAAYGMGGNDIFVLKAKNVSKGVNINGGNGSDTIDLTNSLQGSQSFVTGGGPERDIIKTGPGDDTIVVNNDDVTVTDGNNTLIVEGKGNDDISLGTGADLILVNKTGGSIVVDCCVRGYYKPPEKHKPKRIVYKGEGRIKDGNKNDIIKGGSTPFDVLTMRTYSPKLQSQGDAWFLLIEHGTTIDEYSQQIDLIEVTQNGDMKSIIQQIEFSSIERFEMSEYTTNMLLLKNGEIDYCEVKGGPKHDVVINLSATPLLAEMSTGDNRIFSGEGKDSYSLTLDAGDDVIYDKGGENILAVFLPKGITLNDATISKFDDGYKIEHRARRSRRNHRVKFFFVEIRSNGDRGAIIVPHSSVEIIVGDSTGKQITFKPVTRPSPENDYFSQKRSIGDYYYKRFEYCHGDEDVSSIVEDITPPYGKTLPQQMCQSMRNAKGENINSGN